MKNMAKAPSMAHTNPGAVGASGWFALRDDTLATPRGDIPWKDLLTLRLY